MSVEQEMQEIWTRIDTLLSRLAPEMQYLQPGASEAAIHQAEEKMKVTFPEEAKALYRIHDGCGSMGFFVNTWSFRSLDLLCYEWLCFLNEIPLEAEDLLQAFPCAYESDKAHPFPNAVFQQLCWWHPKWLPFMHGHAGEEYFIDLAPGPKGKIGQVVCYTHTPSTSFLALAAPNLRTFFSKFAEDLEAGEFQFEESTGLLWSQEAFSELDGDSVDDLWEYRQSQTAQMIPHPFILYPEKRDTAFLSKWRVREEGGIDQSPSMQES